MLCTNAIAFPLAALATLSSFAAASPIQKRAGPSGKLVSPSGGTQVNGVEGYALGKIPFVYNTVYQTQESNCAFEGCNIETFYVDVTLKGTSGTSGSYKLVEYLAPKTSGATINAALATPVGACGDFQLVVREYQNLHGQNINFQSAAPTIHIDCAITP